MAYRRGYLLVRSDCCYPIINVAAQCHATRCADVDVAPQRAPVVAELSCGADDAETDQPRKAGMEILCHSSRRVSVAQFTFSLVQLTWPATLGSVCHHAFPTAPSRWTDRSSQQREKKKVKNGSCATRSLVELGDAVAGIPIVGHQAAYDLPDSSRTCAHLASRPGPCVSLGAERGAAEHGMLHPVERALVHRRRQKEEAAKSILHGVRRTALPVPAAIKKSWPTPNLARKPHFRSVHIDGFPNLSTPPKSFYTLISLPFPRIRSCTSVTL